MAADLDPPMIDPKIRAEFCAAGLGMSEFSDWLAEKYPSPQRRAAPAAVAPQSFNAPAPAALPAAAAAARAEQARVSAILAHAEAQGRETVAWQFIRRTRLSADQVAAALAGLPREAAPGAPTSGEQKLLAQFAPSPHVAAVDVFAGAAPASAPPLGEGEPWASVIARVCAQEGIKTQGPARASATPAAGPRASADHYGEGESWRSVIARVSDETGVKTAQHKNEAGIL